MTSYPMSATVTEMNMNMNEFTDLADTADARGTADLKDGNENHMLNQDHVNQENDSENQNETTTDPRATTRNSRMMHHRASYPKSSLDLTNELKYMLESQQDDNRIAQEQRLERDNELLHLYDDYDKTVVFAEYPSFLNNSTLAAQRHETRIAAQNMKKRVMKDDDMNDNDQTQNNASLEIHHPSVQTHVLLVDGIELQQIQRIVEERAEEEQQEKEQLQHHCTTVLNELQQIYQSAGQNMHQQYKEMDSLLSSRISMLKYSTAINHQLQHDGMYQVQQYLLNGIVKHKALIDQHYGHLMCGNSILPDGSIRKSRATAHLPRILCIRVDTLRCIKNKLPGGQYVVLATLYDRLGGHPLRWCKMPVNHHMNAYNNRGSSSSSMYNYTHSSTGNKPIIHTSMTDTPFRHGGKYWNLEMKFDQLQNALYICCPSKAASRPGNVLIFELIHVRSQGYMSGENKGGSSSIGNSGASRGSSKSNNVSGINPYDRVVGWGCFPCVTPAGDLLSGKFRLPLIRGQISKFMDRYSKMNSYIEDDVDHWLCNLYFRAHPIQVRGDRIFNWKTLTYQWKLHYSLHNTSGTSNQNSTSLLHHTSTATTTTTGTSLLSHLTSAAANALKSENLPFPKSDYAASYLQNNSHATALSTLRQHHRSSLSMSSIKLRGNNNNGSNSSAVGTLTGVHHTHAMNHENSTTTNTSILTNSIYAAPTKSIRNTQNKADNNNTLRVDTPLASSTRKKSISVGSSAVTMNNTTANTSLQSPASSTTILPPPPSFHLHTGSTSASSMNNNNNISGAISNTTSLATRRLAFNTTVQANGTSSPRVAAARRTSILMGTANNNPTEGGVGVGTGVVPANTAEDLERERLKKQQSTERAKELREYQYIFRSLEDNVHRTTYDINRHTHKYKFLINELFADITINNLSTFECWSSILMCSLLFWARMYIHYIGQYYYLIYTYNSVHIIHYSATPLNVELSYITSSQHRSTIDAEVLVIGTVTNLLLFAFLILVSFTIQLCITPRLLSDAWFRFIVCYGIMCVLDPVLIVILDACSSNWLYGDYFRLYYTGGIIGICMSAVLLVILMGMGCILMHTYILYVHMNGRMLDLYARLYPHLTSHHPSVLQQQQQSTHGASGGSLYMPRDTEISIRTLRHIIHRAEYFKGLFGTTRKILIARYVSVDPNDSVYKSEMIHISIYNVTGADPSKHKPEQREIYRHFVRHDDGSISEEFDEMLAGANTGDSVGPEYVQIESQWLNELSQQEEQAFLQSLQSVSTSKPRISNTAGHEGGGGEGNRGSDEKATHESVPAVDKGERKLSGVMPPAVNKPSYHMNNRIVQDLRNRRYKPSARSVSSTAGIPLQQAAHLQLQSQQTGTASHSAGQSLPIHTTNDSNTGFCKLTSIPRESDLITHEKRTHQNTQPHVYDLHQEIYHHPEFVDSQRAGMSMMMNGTIIEKDEEDSHTRM